ncbi:10040_t:CDS:2 [Rhizophagus irregularis]|nr:10040_t:CDS:2 [Rhizophagus irregularis]
MSDSESISSDGSNDAIFQNDFIESIPDDSDSSESENDVYDMNARKTDNFCRSEGAYNQINHQNHIEQIHFGYNLDTSASHFEASKAFTKPMLNDIECITIQIKPNRDDHQITNGLEIDQENVGQIGNPIIRRPKGRPPGTARFKRPLEASNEGNKSRKCGLCNESGHNRTTCPVNTNRRKERMMIR